MRIFLSYASEDKATADKIYLSLVKRHKVFFDHTELKGGHDFDDKIRDEIKRCDLFIFLISPDSITKSSYALTELTFAREKWSHPEGHVLPVMIRETGYDAIPPYLSAVTILEPQGNVVAEVRARVEAWDESEKPGIGKNIAIGAGALLVLALIVFLVIKFSGGNGANDNINNSATPQNTTQTPVKNTSPANGQTNNSSVNNQATPNRNFRFPIRNLKIKTVNAERLNANK